jgi:hypothetical protein
MWTWNELDYYLIERYLGPWWRGLRRRSSALTGRWATWRAAWARRHGPLQEETRMPESETALSPAILGRVLLDRLDPGASAAIKAAVTAELLDLVRAEAVTEARAQLDAEFADRHEHLLDDLERQRQQLAKDAAAEADHAAAQQLALDEQDFEDRLDTLRGRVRDWRGRAETAEALVVSLLTQLCGGVDHKAVYLRSGGEGITELDRHAVNTLMARGGLVLKSEQRASERTVATVVEPGKVVAHSLFKIVKAPAPGVVDPEEDTDTAGGI